MDMILGKGFGHPKKMFVHFVALHLRKYLTKGFGKIMVDSKDIGRRLCKNPAYVTL
jgi:hypothetical protein